MPADLLYDTTTTLGTAGRARARRDQVIGMSPKVLEQTDERLVVRRWFSDEVCTWTRVGDRKSDLFELAETEKPAP